MPSWRRVALILVNKALKRELLENTSGSIYRLQNYIPTISKKKYRIITDTSVGGDAPKELMRVYEYEKGIKRAGNPKSWPIYITKTGHKWYPSESVTEYLLNRIGMILDLEMAESKLAFINGQVRFMSKLFRNDKDQMLVHGADLYSGYLGDREFVEEIEEKQLARQFFTISFTHETLRHIYPHHFEDIFLSFTKMLVFDAIVGNNDRHFYNWGVLKHLRDKHSPIFSPIYDTARALFWNNSNNYFLRFTPNPTDRKETILKYIRNSKPKTGVEKNAESNHLDIIKLLYSTKFSGTKDIVSELVTNQNENNIVQLLNDEFANLLSEERISFITECITLRFKYLKGGLK